jgi:hypothetical protein
MKPTLILLALSLAANAALALAISLRPSLAPPAVRDWLDPAGAAAQAAAARQRDERAAAARSRAEAARSAAVQAKLWSALDSDDLPTLVARLRTAGFSRTLILAILNARLEARFADRIHAVTAESENTPFWRLDPMMSVPGNARFSAEYSQIMRERARLLRQLLGEDSMAWSGTDPATVQRRQFGNIPAEKIDLIQRIADDYAEMTAQLRASMQGITLPEDLESLALLEREKRADLAAILTPAELEEYEMRSSPITSRLRAAFTIMDASEEEFRTVFRIYQPLHARIYPTTGGMAPPQMMEERREAQRQLNEQIRAALPPARYEDYLRASTAEYQQLHRITQREGLPVDTAIRAFSLRERVAAESARIADDGSLSPDQKRTALQALAQRGRSDMVVMLGATAGEAYAQVARWLPAVEQGSAVTFNPDGSFSIRSIRAPQPPRQ